MRSRAALIGCGNKRRACLDAAGRIMVPGFLGEHASLQREAVVVGVGDLRIVEDVIAVIRVVELFPQSGGALSVAPAGALIGL